MDAIEMAGVVGLGVMVLAILAIALWPKADQPEEPEVWWVATQNGWVRKSSKGSKLPPSGRGPYRG